MVSSSKILTVSYGTFSCTLEGFDDSFEMMKAISEYFRDLAQEDRYFGAEPPTPDAEMLARIAEREVARRVDARLENGGVVLRPSIGTDAPAPVQTAPAKAADITAPTPDAAQDNAQDAADIAETAQSEDTAEEASDDLDQSIAAVTALAALEDAPAVEPTAEAVAEVGLDDLPELEADSAVEALLDDDIDLDIEAPVEAPIEAVVEPKAAPARPALTDPSSVSAKLSRIRAVVEKTENADLDVEDDYSEDEHAEAIETEASLDFSDIVEDEAEEEFDASSISRLLGDTDTEEDVADVDALLADEGDAAPEDTPLDLSDAISNALSGQADEAPDAAVEEAPAAPQRSRARVVRVKRAAFDAAVAAGVVEPVATEEDGDAQEDAQSLTPGIESSLSSDDEEALTRELADLEAELEEDELEEEIALNADQGADDDDDEISDFDAALDAAFQSDEEEELDATEEPLVLGEAEAVSEEDLADEAEEALETEDKTVDAFFDDEDEDDDDEVSMFAEEDGDDDFSQELEELFSDEDFEDDLDDAVIPEVAQTDVAEDDIDLSETSNDVRRAVKMSSPGRTLLTEGKIAEDASSVSRILDETNQQLDEPEGKTRRNAIAHLRAAVAATRADRILGGKRKDKEVTEAYREDLATVVRPRRPEAAATTPRPARPDQTKPAPLQLVAEQRIDTQEQATPIRPRRVSRKVEQSTQPSSADGSFAEYAERVGASELAELLEAAASYMSFVEGQTQFSRPQLMAKMREADHTDYSREDRLRSFGVLLREGKIAKLEGGKFEVSDNIGFQPQARAAS